jgi:hypothetical protein
MPRRRYLLSSLAAMAVALASVAANARKAVLLSSEQKKLRTGRVAGTGGC